MEEVKPFYPAEWQDDQTMDVLFSPFRENRDINPQSWDRKLKFWREMIWEDCNFSNQPIVNTRTLPQSFRRKGKAPVCLNIVLQQMLRQGKIQRLSDFESNINIGWLSWGFSVLVKKPTSWTYSKIFGMGNEPLGGDFIVTDILKSQCDAILERHYSSVQNESTDHIVDYSHLRSQCQDICPDERVFRLCLMQMIHDKKCTLSKAGKDEQIVRFARHDKGPVSPISELDGKILRLRKAEAFLQGQVMQISEEMARCRTDAKFYLNKGLRNSAKNALRRKKTLERMMEKREDAVETIHLMIQRIQDAESNKMILDAYAAGSSAFKEMAATHGLTTDNIDDVMTDVQEVFDIQSEINDSMAQPVDTPLDVTTADLESELEDILAADTEPAPSGNSLNARLDRLRLAEQQDFDLPEVPTFEPVTPPRKVTDDSSPAKLAEGTNTRGHHQSVPRRALYS